MQPKRLKVNLNAQGYTMELDVRKNDCCYNKTPHWHLCHQGYRIAQISVCGEWTSFPDVSPLIIREAEYLTTYYLSEICEYYRFNAIYGLDC